MGGSDRGSIFLSHRGGGDATNKLAQYTQVAIRTQSSTRYSVSERNVDVDDNTTVKRHRARDAERDGCGDAANAPGGAAPAGGTRRHRIVHLDVAKCHADNLSCIDVRHLVPCAITKLHNQHHAFLPCSREQNCQPAFVPCSRERGCQPAFIPHMYTDTRAAPRRRRRMPHLQRRLSVA